jgi:hypothetical protein
VSATILGLLILGQIHVDRGRMVYGAFYIIAAAGCLTYWALT